MSREANCLRCSKLAEIVTRGLCKTCRNWAQYHGRLSDYPRATRAITEFAADYFVLRARGYTHKEIAREMGYGSPRSVERAVCRARTRGLLPAYAGDADQFWKIAAYTRGATCS